MERGGSGRTNTYGERRVSSPDESAAERVSSENESNDRYSVVSDIEDSPLVEEIVNEDSVSFEEAGSVIDDASVIVPLGLRM